MRSEWIFWVYIMASVSGTLYIGITNYIEKRSNPRWHDLSENWGKRMIFPGESGREKASGSN